MPENIFEIEGPKKPEDLVGRTIKGFSIEDEEMVIELDEGLSLVISMYYDEERCYPPAWRKFGVVAETFSQAPIS
jgi:hypothetical protein